MQREGAVRIGAGQGAFGESPELMLSSLRAGVDYLVCDSLAETTSAFFALDRKADEGAGYAPDLTARVGLALPWIAEGTTRLITNAGGHNPLAAHQAVIQAIRDAGQRGIQVAVVFAEPPQDARATYGPAGDAFAEQVYLGAAGIAQALARGAQIVLTGRVADAALFLAPAIHEWNWGWQDWDRLAGGTVVGHLLECSAQASGGNYSGDWWNTVDLGRTGLPIAEVDGDGSAVITKPPGSGGRVSFDTVREQLLYEVHDPGAYLTPDVVVDLTTTELTDLGDDRVRVSGTRGHPRPETLRGLSFCSGGWAGEALFTYCWPDAAEKGRHVANSLQSLAVSRGLDIEEWLVEQFGADGFWSGMPDECEAPAREPRDVTTRLAWRTRDQRTATDVQRLVALVALSGPPGLQGVGRRRRGPNPPAELVDIAQFLVDRAAVERDTQVLVSST
ncbi:MAG TPA: acyclic terpene utilization AtuA family protein [Frankiaceae bacterium]|nr:acyclic terpene utilization AtuA family protein [Frankiaceae bacterium]